MERFINVTLLKNPVNWVIVISMVAIGAFAFAHIFNASQQG